MLKVNNLFHEDSVHYQNAGKCIYERLEDIENLQDVLFCCAENNEVIQCDIGCLYEQEVEPQISLTD